MKKVIGWTIGAGVLVGIVVPILMIVLENPHVAQGRALFTHYCAGCHGVKGAGDGFNAEFLDPYPRDLTDAFESYMAEGTNEEIFSAIATGVSGYAPSMEGLSKHVHGHNEGGSEGDEGGLERPGMEEGHDMSEMDKPEAVHEEDGHEHGMTGEPDAGHGEAEEDMEMEEDDEGGMGSPLMPYWGFTLSDQEMWELVAYIRTLHPNDADPVGFEEGYEEKRRIPSIVKEVSFPALDSDEGEKLIALGAKLVRDRYACNACHELGGEGGQVGPPLDRTGVRLNPQWIYRWIQDPQRIQRDTIMPAFGVPEKEAKAMTLYLMTLRDGPPSSK